MTDPKDPGDAQNEFSLNAFHFKIHHKLLNTQWKREMQANRKRALKKNPTRCFHYTNFTLCIQTLFIV